MIQQLHSWVYIWTKLYFKKTHAPLFTIAKTWKQPKCPSADEWIRKILSIYLYCYFSRVCLRPYGPWPSRLLCPWDSPGKNTGVGCLALLLEFFPTQGLNPCLMSTCWEAGSLPLAYIHTHMFLFCK